MKNMKLIKEALEAQMAGHTDGSANANGGLLTANDGRNKAEQQINVGYAMKRVLAESFTAEQTAAKALQGFCVTLGWDVGVLWMVDEREGLLRCAEIWSDPGIQADEFKARSREETFARGAGLPGRAWANNEHLWIRDIVHEKNFPRVPMAEQLGLHGAFAAPILIRNGVGAVIEFFSLAVREQDEGLLRTWAALASQLGQFFERKQAEATLRHTEDLYRRAISGAGAVPYAYNYQTKSYVFMGEGIERLIGYKQEEVKPQLWNQITKESFMLGDTAGMTKEEAARRVTSGEFQQWRCDMRVITRAGKMRWISDASVQTVDESGKPTGSMGILEDITERKQAEVISRSFSKLGQSLMSATTPKEAARSIADIANELFGWDACAFYLYFQDTDAIFPVLYVDTFEDGRKDVLPPSDPTKTKPSAIDRRVIENGAELTLKEGPLTMQEGAIPYGDKSRPSASIMRVPVRAGSRVVGILNIHSYTPQAYTQHDLTVLQTLADYCGGALERIWAESALRKSESQFRVVWDSSVDGMRLTNQEGIVVQVNEAYCRMVQKSKSELEGQPLSVVYQTDTASQILTKYQKRMGAKAIEPQFEREVTLWNGRKTWFEVSNSPLEVPDQPGLLLSILRDVSERKQAEVSLRRTEDLYRRAISSADAVPYAYDYGTKSYSFMGEGIEQLIGYTLQEISPALWNKITEESVMCGESAALAKDEAAKMVIAGKIRNWHCDMRVRTRDGETRWISDASVHTYDWSGRFIGSIGILQDITERKQAEVISLAFSKLGQSLMPATTPLEAARSIADIADELFGWDSCAFYLYFQEKNKIYPVFYEDTFEDGRKDVLTPGDFVETEPIGIDRRVIKSGAELTLKEGPLTMQEGAVPYGNTSRPSASIMRVPIHAGKRIVGVINVHSYTLQAYSQKDLTVLQALADYCGGALERIWAENALRQAESQFRMVWNSSVDSMRLTDQNGVVVQVNDAYCRMVQKSKAELEGQPFSIVYHEEVSARILSAYQERFDSKTIESHSEREVTLWNGNKIWFEVSSSQLEIPGQPGLLLSILRDVSGRKQVEAELAYERDLLRTLLENSPDQIYFKDDKSRFIKCSKSLSGRLGISHEELLGKCDLDFFAEKHAHEAFEDEQRIMRTGESVIAKIEMELSKTGAVTWVLTSKMPLRNKAGEIIGTFGISKDITAIKQAEAKLEQIHKQLMDTSRQAGMAEVATSVLHNVGNVLNSVNISSSLASDKVRQSKVSLVANVVRLLQAHADDLPGFFARDPKGQQLPGFLSNLADRLAAEQKEVLQELALLVKNIEHIKEIVAMQQSYAKVSGLLELLPVTDLVEDALRMNAGAMQRHQVKVIREFAEVPPVMVEKHKVLQILVNLIRNAKYALDDGMPPEKRMILRVGTNGDGMVKISVIDNGIGIPAENQTRIFGHGFTTRKDGHGFGLHNGALAARELGGSLAVHSEGIGKGATFTLEFPCKPKAKTI